MWLGFIKNSHCFSFRPTLSPSWFLFMFHCHMFKKHTASGVAALSQHCSPHPHLLTDRQISHRFSAGDHDPLLKIKKTLSMLSPCQAAFSVDFQGRCFLSVKSPDPVLLEVADVNRHSLMSFSPPRQYMHSWWSAACIVSMHNDTPIFTWDIVGEKKARVSHRSKMFEYNSIATSTQL